MNSQDFPASLRWSDEAQARLAHTSSVAYGPCSAEKRLHELQRPPIKLEKQDEARHRVQMDPENSRNCHSDLYEFAPVAYLSLDRAGKIAEINPAGAVLLGVDRAELLQRRFDHFVVPEDRDRWQVQFQKAIAGVSIEKRGEFVLQRDDGSSLGVRLDCLRVEAACSGPELRMAMTNIRATKLNQRLR